MAVLKPHLSDKDKDRVRKTFLIGVVEGDMHDLGKSMVCALLQSGGFKVVDLGIDVSKSKFIEAAEQEEPVILGLGVYMSTTMQEMNEVVQEIERRELLSKMKIMIGGPPTSQEFADEIGVDAWGRDALDAMEKALALVKKDQ